MNAIEKFDLLFSFVRLYREVHPEDSLTVEFWDDHTGTLHRFHNGSKLEMEFTNIDMAIQAVMLTVPSSNWHLRHWKYYWDHQDELK